MAWQVEECLSRITPKLSFKRTSQGGEQLSAWAWSGGNSTWERTNVYGAGMQLATFDSVNGSPALHFLLTDPLGTRRMQTNPAGMPETECQSLPYGDGLNCFAAPNAPASADQANALLFTGKQRDQESGGGAAFSGNDYFGARYYSSTAGRFLSPDWSEDPEGVPYADFGDPQSLNLYEYVGNHPLGGVDADGHCDDGSTECWLDKNVPKVAQAEREAENAWSGTIGQLGGKMLGMLAQHPKTTNAIFTTIQLATAISGIFDAGASELALPVEEAAEAGLKSAVETSVNLAEKPVAEGPELQKIIDELYKPADTVSGGTAGAVRQELATGGQVGGKFHATKALERATQLERGIASGKFSGKDLQTAKAIAQDLRNAVAGK